MAMPSVSLTSLKVTRSTNTRATPSSLPRASCDGGLEALLEHRAVRQPGDRVVQRLVRLLLRVVLQRGHEPAVGEGDVGVVGQRLEQPQVVLDERADLGEPVGHDHRPDRHAVGGERHDRRVLHPDLAEPPRQRLPRLEQPRASSRQAAALRSAASSVRRDVGARSRPRLGSRSRWPARRRGPAAAAAPRARRAGSPAPRAQPPAPAPSISTASPSDRVKSCSVSRFLCRSVSRVYARWSTNSTATTTHDEQPEVGLVPQGARRARCRAWCSRGDEAADEQAPGVTIRRPGKAAEDRDRRASTSDAETRYAAAVRA